MPFIMNDRPPPPPDLTKADATALWHAVEAMRLNLRAMRDLSPEVQDNNPAAAERHKAAMAALRKVRALVRKPKTVKP